MTNKFTIDTALGYVKRAMDEIDEVDVDLPEELVSELEKGKVKWLGIYEEAFSLVVNYQGKAETGKELIDDIFFRAQRGTDIKDALMLISDRIDAGEY